CPTQGSRTNVLIASMQIRAVIDEQGGPFQVALSCKLMQWSDSKPVCLTGLHAVLKQEFRQFTRLASDCNALREVRLMAEHQTDKPVMAISCSIRKGNGIISQCRVGVKDRSGSFDIAV